MEKPNDDNQDMEKVENVCSVLLMCREEEALKSEF